MRKLVIAIALTTLLTLSILLPCYVLFNRLITQIERVKMFQHSIQWLWQGFAIIVFIMAVLDLLLIIEILTW